MTLLLRLRLVLLLVSVGCSHPASAQSVVPVAPEGKTRVVFRSEKAAVSVTVTTAKVPGRGASDSGAAARPSSCTSSREPCSTVNALEILVDSKAVFVPRSVLCRLSDLNTGEIITEGPGWVLKLTGGDASESYVARVEFDRQRVTKLSVFSGMMPDKPIEETVFHVQVLGD